MAEPGAGAAGETWLARRAGGVWGWLIFFVFSLPLLSGVLGRAFKHKPVYDGLEFETIVCAGQRGAEHITMYPAHDAFSCPGLKTTASFVYLPWLADLANAIRSAVGLEALTAGYAVLNFALIGMAIWTATFAKAPPGRPIERAPFLALLTGSIIVWGNIAGPAYGLLAIAGLTAAAMPLAFIAIVAVLGAIKQVWLCSLLVLLLLPIAPWKRIGLFLLGAAVGLAPTAWFVLKSPSEAHAWADVLSYFAFVDRPGQGVMGWMSLFSILPSSTAAKIIWLIYAALMSLAALGICEGRKLSGSQRVWIGLAAASLINPRLIAYEYMVLAPGMVAVVTQSVKAGRRWIEPLVYGSLVLSLIAGIADLGGYAMMPVTLACSVALMLAGLPYAGQGLQVFLSPFSAPDAAAEAATASD